MTPTPFYLWSLAEACEWIIHVPIIGFILLLVLGYFLFAVGAILTSEKR
jgi:hypothetical protein